MLKRLSMALVLGLALVPTVRADQWNIDPVHSTIGFTVRHLVLAKVHGKFKEINGKIDFDGKNLEAGSLDVTIKVASIDTDNEDRDNHLRSPEFFDAEKFPTITFKSKKVTKGEGNKFKVIGDLTIRDVTKEVTLDCEFFGVVAGLMGETRAGFSATTKINRQDFGVSWTKALEGGGLVVGNEVTINLEIEAVKAE